MSDPQHGLNAGRALRDGWELASTAASAVIAPDQLPHDLQWYPAQVPGTVAGSLSALGAWHLDAPTPLGDRDYWYRLELGAVGAHTLRLNGLATVADVWCNDQHVLHSENMFLSHEVDVQLDAHNTLYLCFRSLTHHLATAVPRTPRARWRPLMITPGTLRFVRTTLLGHMSGWCPPVDAIGPWRSIELVPRAGDRAVQLLSMRATLSENGEGLLRVRFQTNSARTDTLSVTCAGVTTVGARIANGECEAELRIPDVAAWWPHTHGTPALHEVHTTLGAHTFLLGKVGFRRIDCERGADGRGFALWVNGVPIFCRGACWTSADIVTLAEGHAHYAPWLRTFVAANMNMVRVGGTMAYEGNAFYELCDELGILVWQDFMFANFDYPVADETFAASVRLEAQQFLSRTQGSPSLAVLCGGSEVLQQAAMYGFTSEAWASALFDQWLPEIVREARDDVPYVSGSPSTGDLPFYANSGPAHYYGVGAYLRPLEDARRADVQFASESLGFANVPEPLTLKQFPQLASPNSAEWKSRIPRDAGSPRDFEDVRDHYLTLLYNVNAEALRREDPEQYLELSRATTAEVMEETFAEWRRARSSCNGALVWNYQDLWAGAGWGIVDHTGEPKSPWYALRRALRPLQVSLSDEGVNGLAIHLHNDHAEARAVTLEFSCYAADTKVVTATRALTLARRSSSEISAAAVLGKFFDTNFAYKFGPCPHDVAVAMLRDSETGALLADAFFFPMGRQTPLPAGNLMVRLLHEAGCWSLLLTSSQAARSVHIEDDNYRASDNWFHLAPNVEYVVQLHPRHSAAPQPNGIVRVLQRADVFAYSSAL